MTGSLPVSVGFAAIGGVSVLVGAVVATRLRLSTRARSLVQHAAAGTVLAGLVVDVLAKLLDRRDHLAATTVGMLLGLAGMLAIRTSLGGEGNDGAKRLVVTVLSDIVVDGVLIGLSAALGAGTGLLFAIALAPEIGLLGVAVAGTLVGRWPPPRVVALAAGIGAGITVAGAAGWLVGQAGQELATGVLGAGASVIIYLVMEELLRQAHETDTGPWEVAVLFACFLPFFLAGIATA